MKQLVFSREEFHRLAWSKPISTLAKELNVKADDLVKAANASNIPRPPVGYWTTLAHNKAAPRIELPEYSGSDADTVELDASVEHQPYVLADHVVNVHNEKKLHPFVRTTLESVRAGIVEGDDDIIYADRSIPSFDIKICKHSLDRAIAFLELLARSAELNHVTLREIDDGNVKRVGFISNEEQVTVRLIEKVLVKRIPDTRPNLYPAKYELTPTHRLELHLEHPINARARFKWADGKRQNIEDLIPSILSGVVAIAAEKTRLRIEREELEASWKREAEIRERKRQQELLDKERQDDLFQRIADWNKASLIRGFIRDAERRCPVEDRTTAFEEWARWANSIADKIDPLSSQNIAENLSGTVSRFSQV